MADSVPNAARGPAPGDATNPADFIRGAALGTRMTVRRRIVGGLTDAVGYLRECGDSECVVETKRGLVTIRLDEVTAAIAVPPPPPRRQPRGLRTTESDSNSAR